jgi:hypothetical protein
MEDSGRKIKEKESFGDWGREEKKRGMGGERERQREKKEGARRQIFGKGNEQAGDNIKTIKKDRSALSVHAHH